MRSVFLVAVATALAGPLRAQSVTCSQQTIGHVTHTNCSNGYSSTTQRIGSQTYTSDNRGSFSHTQQIGTTTYYHDNRGTTGTAQRIGRIEYLNLYSRTESVQGTNQRIGEFDYLDAYSSQGTRIAGFSQRIGHMTYGNYQFRLPPLPAVPERP